MSALNFSSTLYKPSIFKCCINVGFPNVGRSFLANIWAHVLHIYPSAQRLQKLIDLHLPTDCFMKISLKSTGTKCCLMQFCDIWNTAVFQQISDFHDIVLCYKYLETWQLYMYGWQYSTINMRTRYSHTALCSNELLCVFVNMKTCNLYVCQFVYISTYPFALCPAIYSGVWGKGLTKLLCK